MKMDRGYGCLAAAMVMSCALHFAVGAQSVPDGLDGLREGVRACCSALPSSGYTGRPDYMMEFGIPNAVKMPLQSLGLAISNCVEMAYETFPQIATNETERMMFLASAWRLGDSYYLDCLSRNVDLAMAGAISSAELQWFMSGHRNRRLRYILASKYDQPGVSNIVQRLIVYTGATNKYEKVLSGAAKTEYLELEEFMADGPESPLANEHMP